MLNGENDNLEENVEFDVDGDAEPDITALELKNALKKMRNGKAPGMDTIPAELLKWERIESFGCWN